MDITYRLAIMDIELCRDYLINAGSLLSQMGQQINADLLYDMYDGGIDIEAIHAIIADSALAMHLATTTHSQECYELAAACLERLLEQEQII